MLHILSPGVVARLCSQVTNDAASLHTHTHTHTRPLSLVADMFQIYLVLSIFHRSGVLVKDNAVARAYLQLYLVCCDLRLGELLKQLPLHMLEQRPGRGIVQSERRATKLKVSQVLLFMRKRPQYYLILWIFIDLIIHRTAASSDAACE